MDKNSIKLDLLHELSINKHLVIYLSFFPNYQLFYGFQKVDIFPSKSIEIEIKYWYPTGVDVNASLLL